MSREAVWLALSELWLDTELQPFQHAHIARVLKDSGLSLNECEAILRLEVAPRVWLNAWATAGEWTGFDPGWLLQGCRRNQQRHDSRWHRLRCRVLRRWMLGPIREDWEKVVGLLDEKPVQ